MNDVVIRCPHKCHEKPYTKTVDGKDVQVTPLPKILLIATADSVGTFKIQCTGATTRAHGENRGWYKIRLNGIGGCAVTPIPRKQFDIQRIPYVLEDCEC